MKIKIRDKSNNKEKEVKVIQEYINFILVEHQERI